MISDSIFLQYCPTTSIENVKSDPIHQYCPIKPSESHHRQQQLSHSQLQPQQLYETTTVSLQEPQICSQFIHPPSNDWIELTDENSRMKNLYTKLRCEFNELELRYDLLQADKNSLQHLFQRQLSELCEMKKILNQSIDLSEYDRVRIELECNDEKLRNVCVQNKQLRKELEERESDLNRLQTIIDQLTEQNEQLREQIELHGKNQDITAKLLCDIDSMQTKINEYLMNITNLNQENQELRDLIEKFQTEHQIYQSNHNDLDHNHHHLHHNQISSKTSTSHYTLLELLPNETTKTTTITTTATTTMTKTDANETKTLNSQLRLQDSSTKLAKTSTMISIASDDIGGNNLDDDADVDDGESLRKLNNESVATIVDVGEQKRDEKNHLTSQSPMSSSISLPSPSSFVQNNSQNDAKRLFTDPMLNRDNHSSDANLLLKTSLQDDTDNKDGDGDEDVEIRSESAETTIVSMIISDDNVDGIDFSKLDDGSAVPIAETIADIKINDLEKQIYLLKEELIRVREENGQLRDLINITESNQQQNHHQIQSKRNNRNKDINNDTKTKLDQMIQTDPISFHHLETSRKCLKYGIENYPNLNHHHLHYKQLHHKDCNRITTNGGGGGGGSLSNGGTAGTGLKTPMPTKRKKKRRFLCLF
ncbi:hypothetical protein QR98_0018900 [Sarcoptes scabiei]|uniref:Uncharacterized protein n=1 Tax=Sarcoptes scabiei TaxID=52283 RepID=A0A131ZX79_SARSC|nr:hypothetical protein QR98_0018900 [Sarcoptes scabiei]